MHCRRANRPLRDEPVSDGSRHGGGGENGHWVFTVDEPLLAARERHESRADLMARYAQALRVIAAYDTRSALVVCDQLEILGDPVVTMDEAELLLTAEEIEQALPLP